MKAGTLFFAGRPMKNANLTCYAEIKLEYNFPGLMVNSIDGYLNAREFDKAESFIWTQRKLKT